jgi:[Skp1-protein]-hydroxyproline N-acetylglucosaminyltransferase
MIPVIYKLLAIFIIAILIYKYFIKFNRRKYLTNKYFKDYEQNIKTIKNDGRIFVSIASYRDPQLIETVNSLLNNCSDSSTLSIVICEQNDPTDTFSYNNKLSNISMLRMPSKLARGPCWARYLIQQKWQGEQYYLQIDSHTRFVQDWDIKLKSDLSTLSPLSCLSNYVSTYDMKTGNVLKSPLRGPMYVTKIEKDNFLRFNAPYVKSLNKATLSKGWSGCFSFSSSQIILDAPYDPNTPFLFFGEEMDIFARLWTRGWQMYVPSVPICFTLFDRSYRKTFWEHPDYTDVSKLSRERLYHRFRVAEPNNAYSLGSKRTMDDFMKYIR